MKHTTSVMSGFALLVSLFALLSEREASTAPVASLNKASPPLSNTNDTPFLEAPELKLNNGKLTVDTTKNSLKKIEQRLQQQNRELHALRTELNALKQRTRLLSQTTKLQN